MTKVTRSFGGVDMAVNVRRAGAAARQGATLLLARPKQQGGLPSHAAEDWATLLW